MTSDNKINEFVKLIERVIEIAQERIKLRAQGFSDKAPPGALEYLVNGLYQYREEAIAGKLPPSRGVVTLGVLRAVGDWDSESALLIAAKDLEVYYLNEMK